MIPIEEPALTLVQDMNEDSTIRGVRSAAASLLCLLLATTGFAQNREVHLQIAYGPALMTASYSDAQHTVAQNQSLGVRWLFASGFFIETTAQHATGDVVFDAGSPSLRFIYNHDIRFETEHAEAILMAGRTVGITDRLSGDFSAGIGFAKLLGREAIFGQARRDQVYLFADPDDGDFEENQFPIHVTLGLRYRFVHDWGIGFVVSHERANRPFLMRPAGDGDFHEAKSRSTGFRVGISRRVF